MTDNEFLLQDRLQKIRQIINKYGEENFYISFSGGKDSTVLSALVDMAVPENKIPRVYANTGIDLNMVRDFVFDMAKADDRVVIIKPSVPIKQMLEREGYPFKSKEHSLYVSEFQRMGEKSAYYTRYLHPEEKRKTYGCPKILRYQFTSDFNLKISKKCCDRLKKEPMHNWQKEHKKTFTITGMRADEGGNRNNITCFNLKNKRFHPLTVVSKQWENWFISEYNIEICDIYKAPYNFERTGCKGCPFALELQEELDALERFFPKERAQCEIIWKPVYDEYRRLGYRLRKDDGQINMFDNKKQGDLGGALGHPELQKERELPKAPADTQQAESEDKE